MHKKGCDCSDCDFRGGTRYKPPGSQEDLIKDLGAELTALKALLRECLEVVEYCSHGGSFSFLKYGTCHPVAIKAQALIPLLEKIVEVK